MSGQATGVEVPAPTGGELHMQDCEGCVRLAAELADARRVIAMIQAITETYEDQPPAADL